MPSSARQEPITSWGSWALANTSSHRPRSRNAPSSRATATYTHSVTAAKSRARVRCWL